MPWLRMEGGDCRDSWRNPKPRGTKRLEGYLQPTFGSTPQLTLITAHFSDRWKLIESETFVIMGKLSLGSDSNSRLNKKVISGAIWLLPLICPHRLKDFSQTHETVDTPDQSTPQRKDAWTRAGRCGQQRRPRGSWQQTHFDVCQWLPRALRVCVMNVCVHTHETVWSQISRHIWSLISMCEIVDVVRMGASAKLGFQTISLCVWIRYWTG